MGIGHLFRCDSISRPCMIYRSLSNRVLNQPYMPFQLVEIAKKVITVTNVITAITTKAYITVITTITAIVVIKAHNTQPLQLLLPLELEPKESLPLQESII